MTSIVLKYMDEKKIIKGTMNKIYVYEQTIPTTHITDDNIFHRGRDSPRNMKHSHSVTRCFCSLITSGGRSPDGPLCRGPMVAA